MKKMTKGTVEFAGVSKRYRLGTLGTLRGTVSAMLSKGSQDEQQMLWALRDVNFRVKSGESLGMIGPNGSGKTTTLKLLSSITKPTAGQIKVEGRVASLIELGAGFHPELTGLENIYLNGAILGLRRHEIKSKLDSIIAFSELERFIDTPVKRYSSGMYVRLGFAVAAHVEADVLLIDEVLAVGDASFRQKCIERMEELRDSGTTLIFISHNMYQVRRLCQQALLLDKGNPLYLGVTRKAIAAYERLVQSSAQDADDPQKKGHSDSPGTLIISEIVLGNDCTEVSSQLRHDQSLIVRISYHAHKLISNPIVRMRVIRSDNTVCAMTASAYQPGLEWTFDGQGTITIYVEPIQLASGRYLVDLRILDTMDSMVLTSSQSPWFDVIDPAFGHETQRGFFVPNVRWSHQPQAEAQAQPGD